MLDSVARVARRVVMEEAPVIAFPEDADVAHLVRIDDHIPCAIERHPVALQHVRQIQRALIHARSHGWIVGH
jgi:hypothetical protein